MCMPDQLGPANRNYCFKNHLFPNFSVLDSLFWMYNTCLFKYAVGGIFCVTFLMNEIMRI